MDIKYTEKEVYLLEKGVLSCSDVEDVMGDFVDGDLPETLSEKVTGKIERCDECSELERTYKETIRLAKELPDYPITQDIRKRLRMALNQRLGISLSV